MQVWRNYEGLLRYLINIEWIWLNSRVPQSVAFLWGRFSKVVHKKDRCDISIPLPKMRGKIWNNFEYFWSNDYSIENLIERTDTTWQNFLNTTLCGCGSHFPREALQQLNSHPFHHSHLSRNIVENNVITPSPIIQPASVLFLSYIIALIHHLADSMYPLFPKHQKQSNFPSGIVLCDRLLSPSNVNWHNYYHNSPSFSPHPKCIATPPCAHFASITFPIILQPSPHSQCNIPRTHPSHTM